MLMFSGIYSMQASSSKLFQKKSYVDHPLQNRFVRFMINKNVLSPRPKCTMFHIVFSQHNNLKLFVASPFLIIIMKEIVWFDMVDLQFF